MTPKESLENTKADIAATMQALGQAVAAIPERITQVIQDAIAKIGSTLTDAEVMQFSADITDIVRPAVAMTAQIGAYFDNQIATGDPMAGLGDDAAEETS